MENRTIIGLLILAITLALLAYLLLNRKLRNELKGLFQPRWLREAEKIAAERTAPQAQADSKPNPLGDLLHWDKVPADEDGRTILIPLRIENPKAGAVLLETPVPPDPNARPVVRIIGREAVAEHRRQLEALLDPEAATLVTPLEDLPVEPQPPDSGPPKKS